MLIMNAILNVYPRGPHITWFLDGHEVSNGEASTMTAQALARTGKAALDVRTLRNDGPHICFAITL